MLGDQLFRYDFVRPDGSPLMLLYLDLSPYPVRLQPDCQQKIINYVDSMSYPDRYCLATEYARDFFWVDSPQIVDLHGEPFQLGCEKEGVLAHVLWPDIEERINQSPDASLLKVIPELQLRWRLIQELKKMRENEHPEGSQ